SGSKCLAEYCAWRSFSVSLRRPLGLTLDAPMIMLGLPRWRLITGSCIKFPYAEVVGQMNQKQTTRYSPTRWLNAVRRLTGAGLGARRGSGSLMRLRALRF